MTEHVNRDNGTEQEAAGAPVPGAEAPREGQEVEAETREGQPTEVFSLKDAPALVEEAPEREIERLSQANAELKDRLLRALAEQDNVRKRVAREREDTVRYANARLVEGLLPVLDALELALGHVEGAVDDLPPALRGMTEGVGLVRRMFLDALDKTGVRPFDSLGAPFDPHRHEAIGQVDTPGAAPGSVVAVLKTGYLMGERVLRPALVNVAAGAAPMATGGEGDGDDPDATGIMEDPSPVSDG